MEVKIDHAALVNALSLAKTVVEKRNVMPILAHALLEAKDDRLVISATDLEVGIKASIPATVIQAGVATVGAERLLDFARNVSGDIQLKYAAGKLAVRAGRASYSINVLVPDQFPKFPVYDGQMPAFLASLLGDMISRVIFCASADSTQYNINGIFVKPGEGNDLCMVATDRKRLAFDRQAVGNSGLLANGVILPRKGVQGLGKLLEKGGDGAVIALGFNEQFAFAKRGETEIFMRLVDGAYPDFIKAIPEKSRSCAKLKRDEYVQALRRMDGMSAGLVAERRAVTHEFVGDVLTLTAKGEFGVAVEEVAIEGYVGDAGSVGYNPGQVAEALQVMGETIRLETNGYDGPGILTSDAVPGYTHLVMPYRA